MKEFFQWYMVASIVGAWVLIAYAFYRLSHMSESIRILTAESNKLWRDREECVSKIVEIQTASRSDAVKLQLANDELGEDLRALEDSLNKALATKEACIDERILKLKSELSSLRKAVHSFVKSVKSEPLDNLDTFSTRVFGVTVLKPEDANND